MQTADMHSGPVRAKAVLIDAASMTVLWMNEAAAEDFDGSAEQARGVAVDRAVPIAGVLGVLDALPVVAETGTPSHLRTNLVSTSRGSVAIVASVYRLPDGSVLLLMEHAWQTGREKDDGAAAHRRVRRTH